MPSPYWSTSMTRAIADIRRTAGRPRPGRPGLGCPDPGHPDLACPDLACPDLACLDLACTGLPGPGLASPGLGCAARCVCRPGAACRSKPSAIGRLTIPLLR